MRSLYDINLDLDCLSRAVDAVAVRFTSQQTDYHVPSDYKLTRHDTSPDEKYPTKPSVESESLPSDESDSEDEIAREPSHPIV